MNKIDKDYQALLQDIMDNGVSKSDRTGTGTLSVFGRQIRHKMSDGFPLLTTKKMYWKGIVVELLWFLRGDTNIKYLVDNDCHIWDGDAYKAFCKERLEIHNKIVKENPTCDFQPWEETITQEEFISKIKTDPEFAKTWGELGPIYGKQWRRWDRYDQYRMKDNNGNRYYGKGQPIDQIANSVNLLKTDPDSRRNKVSAWNVANLDQMTLPPCHYGFQVWTRELSLEERLLLADKINKEIRQDLYTHSFNNPIYTGGIDQRPDDVERHHLLSDLNIPTRAISLMYNTRSQDVPLGTPFNISSYALLLVIIGKMVNMVPDELIANMGDCHIYSNQIDGVEEQLTREPYPLPKLVISDQVNFSEGIDEFLNSCLITDFQIEGYQSHAAIKMPLSN